MNAEWMLDARKIPDEVMNYLRRIAVQAVEEKHYSPALLRSFNPLYNNNNFSKKPCRDAHV